MDEGNKTLHIPLTGKLITSIDPVLLTTGDFQQLINLRPTDGTPQGVRGMTKINAAATSYLGLRTGYHFKKDQPVENHILVQTNDLTAPATASRLVKSDTTNPIPGTDTLTAFKTLDNNNPCYMSKAPQGALAICNSTKNYIWEGNEGHCYGFVVFDPDNPDTLYDYTDVINNTLTDSANVATMITCGGGIDANTKVLLTAENGSGDATDTSGNSHTFSKGSGVTYTTTNKRFGSYAFSFDGTSNAYLKCSDHADYNLSGGVWTIDTWIRCTNYASSKRGIYMTCNDTDNQFYLYITQSGKVHFIIETGDAIKVAMITEEDTIKLSTWQHIEVGEDGDEYYLFVDGILRAQATSTDRPLNYTREVEIGRWDDDSNKGDYFIGQMDEIRLTVGAIRHTSSFSPMSSAYSSSVISNLFIASTRPLYGFKPYIGTVNASAAIVTGEYWNGSWTAVSNLVDGTSSGGKTLAVTGAISWDDTVSDAKVKIINNQQYYWYKFAFTGVDATTTVYYCTLLSNIQEIKDIWDSSLRACLSGLSYSSSYSDYTLNFLKNDYYSLDTGSYVNIDNMLTSHALYFGFIERTMGIYFSFAEGYANITAGTICTIYYWNGSAWTTVGTLSDGTSQGGISFSRSGVISWDAPSSSLEYQWTPNNGTPLYYYKVVFSKTLDGPSSSDKVYLNYVAGIPAQSAINPYKFPLFWKNRLLLCGSQTGRKNMVRYSATDTNCVFNGLDSYEIPIDGDDELVAGATLFTRIGGDVYDSAILCKRNQTILLDVDPNDESQFKASIISSNKGCVAPYTMKMCDVGFDVAPNIRKHIIVFLSSMGLMMFDGVSVGNISEYFENIFDPLDSEYINLTYINQSYGEYDPVNHEYVLIVPVGATPTWKEIHYRLKKQVPFHVSRGAKYLRCLFQVEDSNGSKYMYGGTNDGYVERLEYGTTFDGVSIPYTFWISDVCPTKDPMKLSKIQGIQIIGKSKTTTTENITATHYVDGISSGQTLTASPVISQNDSTHRIFRRYFPTKSLIKAGIWQSTKFTITTNNENRGMEPIMVSYFYTEEAPVYN